MRGSNATRIAKRTPAQRALHAGHHVANAAPAVEPAVKHFQLGRRHEREADGGADKARAASSLDHGAPTNHQNAAAPSTSTATVKGAQRIGEGPPLRTLCDRSRRSVNRRPIVLTGAPRPKFPSASSARRAYA